MLVEEEYSAKLTVERSRFFAVLFPAIDEAAVKEVLARRRKEVKRARHHCWAARFISAGKVVELVRDDGEVGRPGHKILELLRRHEIEGALVVSRIFGGVKLGPAGVGRAFQKAAALVLAEAGVVVSK
jgi:putative IMPACT (imprinted ancient) family translation regulator